MVGQGEALFARACRFKLEGVVSKLLASKYGRGRSLGWIKVRCGQRQELVVGRFTAARGGSRGLGALLLGVYDDDGNLVYAGKVDTGYDHQGVAKILARLSKLGVSASPFQTAPPGLAAAALCGRRS